MQRQLKLRWPYRQHDPLWNSDLMWEHETVISVGRFYNGFSKRKAQGFLWKYREGNTIGNEGCLITCLSMVLQLLYQDEGQWTPARLNTYAQQNLYYTLSGLSMVTLYADLVGEASKGHVQLLLKEEYHPGNTCYPKKFCSSCLPIQAYLSLPKNEQMQCTVMIKTGTYDDTFASHYMLVDTNHAKPSHDDIAVLDPCQPLNSKKPIWLISDSSKVLRKDRSIRTEWNHLHIHSLQIAGVWVFCRWQPTCHRILGEPFIAALYRELTRPSVLKT